MCLDARVVAEQGGRPDVASAVKEVKALVASFGDHYAAKVAKWSEKLAALHGAGKRTAIWGVGSKGVTFLNVLPEGKNVSAAVDINDQKLGRYVPGTGQQIVEPEALVELGVDFLVVMNPLYEGEIREAVKSLGIDAEIVSA